MTPLDYYNDLVGANIGSLNVYHNALMLGVREYFNTVIMAETPKETSISCQVISFQNPYQFGGNTYEPKKNTVTYVNFPHRSLIDRQDWIDAMLQFCKGHTLEIDSILRQSNDTLTHEYSKCLTTFHHFYSQYTAILKTLYQSEQEPLREPITVSGNLYDFKSFSEKIATVNAIRKNITLLEDEWNKVYTRLKQELEQLYTIYLINERYWSILIYILENDNDIGIHAQEILYINIQSRVKLMEFMTMLKNFSPQQLHAYLRENNFQGNIEIQD